MLLPHDFLPSLDKPPARPQRPVPTHVRLTRIAIGLAALAPIPALVQAIGPSGTAAVYSAAMAAWIVWLNLR